MHHVPRIAVNGVDEIHARLTFNAKIVQCITSRGYSIHAFEKAFGIYVRSTTKYVGDFDGKTVQRIVEALNLSSQDAEHIWNAFYGKKPETVMEMFRACARRHGCNAIATRTGINATFVWQILQGKMRKEGPKTPPMFPGWRLMRTLASMCGLSESEMYERWLQDARIHFRRKMGCTLAGAEVETILAENNVTSNTWVKREPPAAFGDMPRLRLRMLLSEMRAGIVQRWSLMQKLCDAVNAPQRRRDDLLHAICITLVEKSAVLIPLRSLPQWKYRIEPDALNIVRRAYLSGKDTEEALRVAVRYIS